MHLDRLVPRLQEEGLKVGVLNHFHSAQRSFVVGTLNRNPLKYFFSPRRFSTEIIHYHHSNLANLVAVALGVRSRQTCYIVTFHGQSILKHLSVSTSHPTARSRLASWAIRRFDIVIVVNAQVASVIEKHLSNGRLEVIPAFVEPGHEELDVYDEQLESFLQQGYVIVVAAYGVQFRQDGKELYGLDIAVEAFSRLSAHRSDLRLALFIARRPKRAKAVRHLADLESRLATLGLRRRVHIAFDCPLRPAFRPNAIFARPTREDGDALSIREAQREGVPVVASNVAARPPGVVVFPEGDVSALCLALTKVLDDIRSMPPLTRTVFCEAESESFSERLMELYRSERAIRRESRRTEERTAVDNARCR